MIELTDPFRCTCDPADLFDPPDPRPRVVVGCPAHRARAAVQREIEARRPDGRPLTGNVQFYTG